MFRYLVKKKLVFSKHYSVTSFGRAAGSGFNGCLGKPALCNRYRKRFDNGLVDTGAAPPNDVLAQNSRLECVLHDSVKPDVVLGFNEATTIGLNSPVLHRRKFSSYVHCSH